jgi:hypothetical protein
MAPKDRRCPHGWTGTSAFCPSAVSAIADGAMPGFDRARIRGIASNRECEAVLRISNRGQALPRIADDVVVFRHACRRDSRRCQTPCRRHPSCTGRGGPLEGSGISSSASRFSAMAVWSIADEAMPDPDREQTRNQPIPRIASESAVRHCFRFRSLRAQPRTACAARQVMAAPAASSSDVPRNTGRMPRWPPMNPPMSGPATCPTYCDDVAYPSSMPVARAGA